MAGKGSYQINNLKITFSNKSSKWLVKSPNGRVLEEFRLLERAKAWAKRNHDHRTGSVTKYF